MDSITTSTEVLLDQMQQLSDLLTKRGLQADVLGTAKVVVAPVPSQTTAGRQEAHDGEEDDEEGRLPYCPMDSSTSDVLLILPGGRRVHAHSAILSLRSQFFKNALENDFKEKSTRCITLEELPSMDVWDTTLQFLYTGSLAGLRCSGPDGVDNLMHLMRMARYLLSDELTTACCDLIEDRVRHNQHGKIIKHLLFSTDLIPATFIANILDTKSLSASQRLEVAIRWVKGAISTPSEAMPLLPLIQEVARSTTPSTIIQLSSTFGDTINCLLTASTLVPVLAQLQEQCDKMKWDQSNKRKYSQSDDEEEFDDV